MSRILVTQADGVRTLTLNRPEKRNALDAEMLALLMSLFAAAPEADERVTVIRAAGVAFCAGIDLRERLGQPAPGPRVSAVEAFRAIQTYPLPVVAVVQGDAIAGGNELALHCDLVVAATTARFAMPLAQLGLALPWLLVKRLLDVAGPVGAREYLLLGDPLPAERLCQLGVISRAVPPERLEEAANAVIGRLAANAPLSLRALKAMLLRGDRDSDDAPDDADALAAAARTSADAREGILARLEHRTPRFTGR